MSRRGKAGSGRGTVKATSSPSTAKVMGSEVDSLRAAANTGVLAGYCMRLVLLG
jgi:hypothetical protein